jgi:ABC-type nickel/cobalt efflux system permease component RcnA
VLSFLAILILGFFLGMRHAIDPDHVVAVTTIVTKQRGIAKAGLIGVLWGLGHTFTIFVVGSMIILFQVTIPPRVGLCMELTVAVMLILLGVLNLTGTLRWLQERFTPNSRVPTAADFRSDALLVGAQCCDATAQIQRENIKAKFRLHRMLQSLGLYNVLRPLAIGIVHGLAGSAAVALLVMTTIRDPWWAITYLFLFGIGTIAGMMIITAVIAMPFDFTVRRFSGWNRGMAVASGLLSLAFGLFLSYQIGFVDGLFTTHAHWTPR